MTTQEERLLALVEESLATFSEIESVAKEKLRISSSDPENSFAAMNTFTSNAVDKLANIQDENRKGYYSLIGEPAVARVLVEDENGEEQVYYISRSSTIPLSGSAKLASYHSDIGRLASLPVGDEQELHIGKQDVIFSVLEKTTYRPYRDVVGWDSVPTVVRNETYGVHTIESLRQLLPTRKVDSSDELDALLAGEASSGIFEGLSHQIRTAMELRDQPILDQFQDEIFRLPLNSQLIILGPPGTGKTTTLIKRLGQKLDRQYLDEGELQFSIDDGQVSHTINWMMFTPSDLLKQYVKEAFNKELVPASDERIKTWEKYRIDIARSVLGILKTATSGRFIHTADQQFLYSALANDARNWFEKFAASHHERIAKQLNEGIAMIKEACPSDKTELVGQVENAVGNPLERKLTAIYSALIDIERNILPTLAASKKSSDDLIKRERNFLYNANKRVFHELAEFLSSLQEDEDAEDDEEMFDEDTDQMVQSSQTQTEIQKAVRTYIGTIRSLARYKYLKRSVPKKSKAALIRDWLQDRLPSSEVLGNIGQEIAFQNGLRRFVNASRRYVTEVPNSYRAFRKSYLEDDNVYHQAPTNVNHIDSTELDTIILVMLRNVRELLAQPFVARNIEEAQFTTLATISSLFRTQVLVDEATDFSVLQLACMESLTMIDSQSFFACGDFNQRVTGNGVRSLEQLQWVSSRLKEKKITTVYRQSEVLNKFARELIEIQDGDLTSLGQLPDGSTHMGVQPVLVEHSTSMDVTAEWLSQRITEVEKVVRQMPTIAILVSREEDVKPMAEALDRCLKEQNLRAIACLEGQSLGHGTDVRVFDVQHIKGLEFEAVFFVEIDQLAENMPDLFDRYLYVGATRAATYLGLICRSTMPDSLEPLRGHFIDNWS